MVSLTQLISQESITLLDAADLTSQVCTALISRYRCKDCDAEYIG